MVTWHGGGVGREDEAVGSEDRDEGRIRILECFVTFGFNFKLNGSH